VRRARSAAATGRVTVVVICHDYGRFLRQAVESVMEQTLRPRILILDDASTDETPEVVAELKRRDAGLEAHREPHNRGLSTLRNLAAERVASEWIVYLDADDWLAPRYVERALRRLDRDPEVDVLTTDMTIVRGRFRRLRWRARAPREPADLARANTVAQTSFVRQEMVGELGGYDPALHYEDWDFWIRALRAGRRFDRLPGRHIYRREHGANKSKLCDDDEATAQIRRKHGL